MAKRPEWGRNVRVLRNTRDATRYQILVEIAERQPAVSQAEIAEALGITPQAVSEYLNELVENGQVEKMGRGRWEVTHQGVDWLISQTDELRDFTRYVWEEVIEQGGVEAAIAAADIDEGDEVTLSMDDGVLHARRGGEGPATATAVTDAEEGGAVGVADFAGLLDFEVGRVTIVVVPPVEEGGSLPVDPTQFEAYAEGHDRIAAVGPEAIAVVRAAGASPDLQFGTPEAVQEAALKGLDVVLATVATELSRHTDRLREFDIPLEIIEDYRD